MPMQPQRFEFTKWEPDRIEPHRGFTFIKNAVPAVDGYLGIRSFVGNTSALPEVPHSAGWARTLTGTPVLYAVTSAGIYKLQSNRSWLKVHTISSMHAQLAQFGSNVLVFSQEFDALKVNIGSNPNSFSALAGSPPRANRVAVVGDFVWVADVANDPSRVRWCGYNNAELWAPDPVTQADGQRLPSEDGAVTAVVPIGRGAMVFQENAIHSYVKVDTEAIYDRRRIGLELGTRASDSVVSFGGEVYFYSPDGFCSINPRSGLQYIGTNRVDEWFKSQTSTPQDIRGTVDPKNKVVAWSYRSPGAESYDRLLLYRFDVGRWGLIEEVHQTSLRSITQSASVDSDTFNDFYGNTMDGPEQTPFDAQFWVGGAINFSIFKNKKMGEFDGSAKSSEFESSWFNVYPFHETFLTRHCGIIGQCGNYDSQIMIQAKARPTISVQSEEDFDEDMISEEGVAGVRVYGRFLKLKALINGGFRGFKGFIPEVSNMGKWVT